MNLMSLSSKFLHWFTPHPSNAYKPRILHQRSLLFLILLFVFFEIGVVAATQSFPQVLGFASDIPPEQIVSLTNQARIENGLPPLHLDNELTQAALAKASYMFAKDYWAHVAPDGTQPWAFITQAGYDYLHAGENLARDFTNADAVVTAWMNSPSHRENILNPNYQDIGVAVADGTLGGAETTLVVQMFGTRLGANPQISAIAQTSPTKTAPTPPATANYLPAAVTSSSSSPQPQVAAFQAGSNQAHSAQQTTFHSLFSPFSLTQAIASTVVTLVMLALALDMILVWRRRVIRLSGRSWAHLIYLLAMLSALIIIRSGQIT